MAGRHVRKEPYGKRQRARKLADYFNRHHQRQQQRRRAGRDQNPEELDAVVGEPHDDAHRVDKQRKRCRHDDLARHSIRPRNQAQEIRKENKDKQRADEGEEPHPLLPDGIHDHAAEKFHEHFGDALQP